MTMLFERARALRRAGQLLSELQSCPDVPEEIFLIAEFFTSQVAFGIERSICIQGHELATLMAAIGAPSGSCLLF